MKTKPAFVLPFLAALLVFWAAGCATIPPETLYSGFLPALEQTVRVESLLLFEAGKTLPDRSEIQHRTTFSAKETRYVYGEVRLRYPDTREDDIELATMAVWTDATGAEIERQPVNANIDRGWVRSHHIWGLGSEEAGGFWTPGTYKVSLYSGGTLLVSQPFRVE
jgi:hypothetical protein